MLLLRLLNQNRKKSSAEEQNEKRKLKKALTEAWLGVEVCIFHINTHTRVHMGCAGRQVHTQMCIASSTTSTSYIIKSKLIFTLKKEAGGMVGVPQEQSLLHGTILSLLGHQ